MHFTTASTVTNQRAFRNHYLLHGLMTWFVLIWGILAIDPIDRHDWALENILVGGLVIFLVATYRWFPLSDLSYIFIVVFLTLHAVGAHYTYAKVPLGFWIQDGWELTRNPFDRIAHFSFGLILAYPLRELFLRRVNVRGFWAYYLPISGILALSGLFEIGESWIVRLVNPELGEAYLGTQGDEWDAQKDMTVALVGALLTMTATFLVSVFVPKKSHTSSS